jgi:steroid delta-isomerase-like uncharacterized protein
MPENDALEQNKAIMRRMLEAFNTGNIATVAELFDKNINDRGNRVGFEREMQTAHPTKRVQTEIMREEDAFPDREFKEEVIIAEGDLVMLHWTMTGTHRGQILGRPATGRKVKTSGTEIIRVKNGKIVEHMGNDSGHVLDLLMQLDLLDEGVQQQLKTGAPELAAGFRSAR